MSTINPMSVRSVRMTKRHTKLLASIRASLLVLALAATFGCDAGDMQAQPRYDPLEKSDFFPDQRASRPPVPGTIARGQLHLDEHMYAGKVGEKMADTFPFAVDEKIMLRGQKLFDIYCSVCHGRVGNGEGMVVQRGFRKPPTYHSKRLRDAKLGHFFDVITNGFGVMPSFKSRIEAPDRWAIVAYIRALQLSQHAWLEDVPAERRNKLLQENQP